MVEIKFEKDRNRAIALADGKQIGVCGYTVDGDSWVIDRTWVRKEFGGQGIARRLVECVLSEAETAGAVPEATCSYAVDMLEKRKGNHP